MFPRTSQAARGKGSTTGRRLTLMAAVILCTVAATSIWLSGHISAQGEGDVANGASIWPSLPCVTCHGDQGEGQIGPKIAGTGLSFDSILLQVRNGGGIMPAFGPDEITDDELRDVYAWLVSLGESATEGALDLPYSVDNLLGFFSSVSELKVRSDFAKDLPERLAPDDPAEQLELLKQYTQEGLGFGSEALSQGDAAMNDIPDPAVQEIISQATNFVRQIVSAGDAALGAESFQEAWPHAAEMVRLSRLDAWPLAAQAVRDAGWVGQVTVNVTDQSGAPLEGALVTVLSAHNPAAAMTDANGVAVIDGVAAVPALQVKAYSDGLVYHEVHAQLQAGGSVDATIVLPGPSAGGQTPAVSGAEVNPVTGPGDADVTFSVTATDPQGKANLAEDQVFALSPDLGVAYVLREASGDLWQSTVRLPNLSPGTYDFYVFAVDHQCNTSNITTVSYTVT